MPTFTEPPSGGKGQIRLRLVHPSPPKPPKRRHRRASVWTADEEARLRAALKSARVAFGSWGLLAAAMGTCPNTLARSAMARRVLSAEVAVRLARVLGKPLETLYRAPADASRCPTCGAARGAP